jgi:hypothetical protein
VLPEGSKFHWKVDLALPTGFEWNFGISKLVSDGILASFWWLLEPDSVPAIFPWSLVVPWNLVRPFR